MCGISGILMKSGTPVDRIKLKAMNDAVQHRGPDGEGFYYDGPVGLGHRRLSILELSELGSQPMQTGDYSITYNGEVYNYIEVREILKQKGYKFKGGSDTEVILAAYQEWGESCVLQFNGMWSFAIHDRKRNKVFISRDRFGVKPLYYFENEDSLLFGSEIRQILTQLTERKVNRQILFDYFYLGYHHHTPETFFEKIYSLDPGHNLVFDLSSGTFIIKRWYELKTQNKFKNLSFNEAQKLFESTLDSAIHLRLRSDVKVGTCLSGGMDSSYIATVAAKEYNAKAHENFTAITAKSIEVDTDESYFAEIVVKHADLNWKVTQPGKDDFWRVAEDVIVTQEEPFGSPSIVMQYFVMQKANQEGCTVMLDGQGGDEALLGYDRYYAAYLNQQVGFLNKVKSYFRISKNSNLSLKELFLYDFYFNNAKVRAFRQLRRNNFVKPEFKSFLNQKLLKTVSDAGKNIEELQLLEITRVQLQKLLKYEDRNSMRFSIEARVPFVDFNVVELAISLPFTFKMYKGWSKYILRKSAENKLPEEIVWRRNKFGFEAPTKSWLADRGVLLDRIRKSDFLTNFIDMGKIRNDMDEITLWKLFNIAVWASKFQVKF